MRDLPHGPQILTPHGVALIESELVNHLKTALDGEAALIPALANNGESLMWIGGAPACSALFWRIPAFISAAARPLKCSISHD